MKKTLLLLALALCPASAFALKHADLKFPDGTVVDAEIADTPETYARGLMERTSLGKNKGMLTPLQSAMFALLAFYIVSAAARTFRVRSAQTAVLSLAALVVLIARVPPGQQLADAAGLGSVKNFVEWLLTVPAVAVRRALMCGIALGIIVTSVKIIFGIERGYAGRRR